MQEAVKCESDEQNLFEDFSFVKFELRIEDNFLFN